MFFLLMIILFILLYLILKILLSYLVRKYGKFSFDGFNALGYQYIPKQDIFYSVKNAWQKKFGYTHNYDVVSPLFRMIMDTEAIKFYYQKQNWLIMFWKGQYGLVTGGEIGIYTTKEQKIKKNTIYHPISKKDYLHMSIILYKHGKKIAQLSSKHWWLAIFKLGMFSNPEELAMDINITFKDKEMLTAFLNSFKKIGYTEKDYKTIDNTFCFFYKKPHTKKVWTRTKLTDFLTQKLNQKNVNLYNEYLQKYIENDKIDDFQNRKKKRIFINDYIPEILKNKEEKEKTKNIIFLKDDIYSDLKGESS